MVTEGTARLRLAVICLCVAATASLVSLGASLFRINGAFVDNLVFMAARNSTSWNNLLLIMAIAGAAGATVGLIVIHQARRTGWPILLLAGTVLTAVHLVPVVGLPETLRDNGSEVVFAAIGAGAVLALLGVLGAANWLIHAGAPGSGYMIAGLALVARFSAPSCCAFFRSWRPPISPS